VSKPPAQSRCRTCAASASCDRGSRDSLDHTRGSGSSRAIIPQLEGAHRGAVYSFIPSSLGSRAHTVANVHDRAQSLAYRDARVPKPLRAVVRDLISASGTGWRSR